MPTSQCAGQVIEHERAGPSQHPFDRRGQERADDAAAGEGCQQEPVSGGRQLHRGIRSDGVEDHDGEGGAGGEVENSRSWPRAPAAPVGATETQSLGDVRPHRARSGSGHSEPAPDEQAARRPPRSTARPAQRTRQPHRRRPVRHPGAARETHWPSPPPHTTARSPGTAGRAARSAAGSTGPRCRRSVSADADSEGDEVEQPDCWRSRSGRRPARARRPARPGQGWRRASLGDGRPGRRAHRPAGRTAAREPSGRKPARRSGSATG